MWSSRSFRCVEESKSEPMGFAVHPSDCTGAGAPKFVVFMVVDVGGCRWLNRDVADYEQSIIVAIQLDNGTNFW